MRLFTGFLVAALAGCGGSGGNSKLFVTSATFSGNLGGLSGADAKCNAAAQSAGLAGTFVAWLSDSNADAITRVQDFGPWSLVGGQMVFSNKASLATGPSVAPNQDERGAQVQGQVWTGTAGGGLMASTACVDWSADTSSESGVGGDWGAPPRTGPRARLGALCATARFPSIAFNSSNVIAFPNARASGGTSSLP